MKSKILERILKIITVRIIAKYNPLIVAVTGSVGKTSTKDAIYTTLNKYKNTEKSSRNFNTEIGAPLVFFRVDEPGKDVKSWLRILWKGVKLILKNDDNYPEVIVMEMAADRKGDIEYLTSFIKPHIGVVTAIGDTPVHLEFFENVNEVVKEKSLLVKHTKKGGTVILNGDDGRVFQMKGRAKAKVKTFGLSNRAEIRAKNIKLTGTEKDPRGIQFSVNHGTEEHKIELPNVFDEGSVYSVLAAVGVGVSLSIPVYRLVESAAEFMPPKGRMRLLKGDGFNIIDSSYNAAPKSTELALETLKKLPGKRKVAVLGDMLELGQSSKEAHEKIGERCKFLDVLITVGEDSELIGPSAKENGFKGDIFHFKSAERATEKVEKLTSKGDLILIKGSQSIRTEEIVEKLMTGDPQKELVRQYHPWKKDGQN